MVVWLIDSIKRFDRANDNGLFRGPLFWIFYGILLGVLSDGLEKGFWPWLLWIALGPWLFGVSRASSLSKAFLIGVCLGVGQQGWVFQWILDLHPLSWLGFEDGLSLLVSIATWVMEITCGALLYGLLAVVYRQSSHQLGWFWAGILFMVLWPLSFWAWGRFDLYMPWGWLEYGLAPWAALPWVHPVMLIGVNHFLTGVFTGMVEKGRAVAPLKIFCLGKVKSSVVVFGLVVLAVGVGLFFQSPPPPKPLPIPVVVLQGDLPIDVIRSEAALSRVSYQRYIAPIQRTTFSPGTLVVLPEEGVIQGWVSEEASFNHPQMAVLQQLANQKRIGIITGLATITVKSGQHPQYFNAIALVQPNESVQFYHKEHLVSFGESEPRLGGLLPAGWIEASLKPFGLSYGFLFSRGSSGEAPFLRYYPIANGFVSKRPITLIPTVCFELASQPWEFDAQKLLRTNSSPDSVSPLLINVSNLGWFHDHPMMEAQFAAMAQYKAAKAGFPVVIAANTGPSGMIDGRGQWLQKSPLTIKTPNQTGKKPLLLKVDPPEGLRSQSK